MTPTGTSTRKSFLGVGWKFPIELDRRKGVAMSTFEENIEESILIILGTALGERVMRPDFGCAAHDLVFAPNNANTHGLMVYYVKEALTRWEPRIQGLKVTARADPDELERLDVSIEYQVIATNNIFNLVYPFYLQKSP